MPGKPVASSEFTVHRGSTILTAEPGWFIEAPEIGLTGVVEVSEDGQHLTISDNHYDGFNRHYRRVE